MRTPPSWPHLNLTTSQRPHLLMLTHGRLGLQRRNVGGMQTFSLQQIWRMRCWPCKEMEEKEFIHGGDRDGRGAEAGISLVWSRGRKASWLVRGVWGGEWRGVPVVCCCVRNHSQTQCLTSFLRAPWVGEAEPGSSFVCFLFFHFLYGIPTAQSFNPYEMSNFLEWIPVRMLTTDLVGHCFFFQIKKMKFTRNPATPSKHTTSILMYKLLPSRHFHTHVCTNTANLKLLYLVCNQILNCLFWGVINIDSYLDSKYYWQGQF